MINKYSMVPNNCAAHLLIFSEFVPQHVLFGTTSQYIKVPTTATSLLIFKVLVPPTRLFELHGYSAP